MNPAMAALQANQMHPGLQHSTQEIRLLSQCDDVASRLAYSISVFDLSHIPPYIALSYPFFVRHNLYLALGSIASHIKIALRQQRLGYGMSEPIAPEADFTRESQPGNWKYFWIDAICIDQTNIPERNHQVRLMSNIYKSAAFVLVWLGPSCEEALRTMSTADGSMLHTVFKPYTDHFLRSKFSERLIPFLASAYWTRMWVVQEFVLANKLVLAAGSILANWESIDSLLPDIYGYHSTSEYAPAIRMANGRRQHMSRAKGNIKPNLHELFQRFRQLECSDRRDRVFALFGLLQHGSDRECDRLLVDYSLPSAQLLVSTLRLYQRTINYRGSLETLQAWLEDSLDIHERDFDRETQAELMQVFDAAMGI
ncbi:hypothetical protein CC86DRAFT_366452 [Ophiobolus disseminans]|uniref:Heterokaryon incompatibility domain-containing protein n=1 Tax=Ophiobolus disseminans TaxID=1469910 RepID=A0A6A7ACA1_9PLEO|nr:hypothetical protein CC86DRAFT_366452 [Ophiobolus disseminans]